MAPSTSELLQDLSPKDLALSIAAMLDARQGGDIAILDVSGPLVIADYFVLVTARNPRHATGMAQEVDFTLKKSGRLRRNISGEGGSPWVLLDFNEVVLHIFVGDARTFYDLDHLWADVPRVPFESDAGQGDLAPPEHDTVDGSADGSSTGPLRKADPTDGDDPNVLRPDPGEH